MKEIKTDRRTRYTKMVIQDSLIKLMKKKPIAKITIKELCENADINRTTFYAHYSDQYEVLSVIENQTISYANEMLIKLKENDISESVKIIESIFEYFVENIKYIEVLMSEQGDITFQKKLFVLIYEQFGKYPFIKKNSSDNNNELRFIYAVNGSIGIIQYWIKTGLKKPAKEMAEIICEMAFV